MSKLFKRIRKSAIRASRGLLLIVWLGVATAGPVEDMALANLAYERGDVVDAIVQFRRAAERGYAPAQVRLAYILDQSERNGDALLWYHRAAEQGDAEGQYGLGQMYLTGEAGEKNLSLARSWITRAALGGHTPAMRTLALSFEHGDMGLPVNPRQALNWLRRAAQSGDQWAQKRLQEETAVTETN